MSIVISQLNIYPIKSCAGISVDCASISNRGFYFDRLWMLIDENNKFITQRIEPTMALIHVDLFYRNTEQKILDQVNESKLRLALSRPSEHVTLMVTAPNMPELTVKPVFAEGKLCTVTIFRDTCTAVDEGEEAAHWFTSYLGSKCRLVRMHEEFVRQVDQQYAKNASDQVGFADGYPFLLVSEESLEDLNNRLDERLPMNRFRPNIVISGGKEFAEDDWQTVRMNGIDFDLVKPCARCVITTVNQITAEVGQEPLKALSKYRTKDNKVLFAQNLVHRNVGKVSVGDQVNIIEAKTKT